MLFRSVRVARVVELARQRGAVDRGDNEEVDPLGDHIVDLIGLRGDVVLRELEVDPVSEVLQLRLDVIAVLDPALGGLGRHGDADLDLGGVEVGGVVGAGAAGAGAAAGGEGGSAREGEGAREDEL